MNRLVLFSFYDKDGIVDECVFYLIESLKYIASKLVIIVNGDVENECKERLCNIADEVLQRENKGFDAGAYKDAMVNYIGIEKLREFDELVLCNDTFLGPLQSFEKIWSRFQKSNTDFWGLHLWQAGYLKYISSFFLVYKKTILLDPRFYDYWNINIDENCRNIKEVYGTFEVGLFYQLCEWGYRYGVYADCGLCQIMKSPDWAIEKYDLPIIKKKIFDPEYSKFTNIGKMLRTLGEKKVYPVEWIFTLVHRKYGYQLESQVPSSQTAMDTKEYLTYPRNRAVKDIDMLRQICNSWQNETIYIYGAGTMAAKVYFLLKKYIQQFGGFVVSRKETESLLFGQPIVEYKKNAKQDLHIIVAMNPKNSDEIRTFLPETENVVYIWGCYSECSQL